MEDQTIDRTQIGPIHYLESRFDRAFRRLFRPSATQSQPCHRMPFIRLSHLPLIIR